MKAPAFQLYPQDFISSLDCQTMTHDEFGVYCWLLFHSWIQEPQCCLPNDPEKLSRLLRINPRTFAKMWRNSLEKKFKISNCGFFIYNERLKAEHEKQEAYRKKQALNGSKGGRPPKEENPNKPTAFSGNDSGLTQTETKESSSFSISSSTSVNTNTIPAAPKGSDKQAYFLKLFNEHTKRTFRTLDSKAKQQFDKLLKAGYTSADFILAIANGFKDSATWPKPQLFTPEYISREANFLKYLNWQIETQIPKAEPVNGGSITKQQYVEMFFGLPKEPINERITTQP